MAERRGAASGARSSETADPQTAQDGALDGVRHVMFVHAHPDDETLASGALMAELVDRGLIVTLVTCTRGERGEIVAGPHSHLEGAPEFAEHREHELAGALAELGVTRHLWLGTAPARAVGLTPRAYEDSGMRWLRDGLAGPADDASPLSLTAAPLDDAVADLLAVIDVESASGATAADQPSPPSEKPDLIVSYNEIGGYGHPDHVRAREIARAAAGARSIRFAEIVDAVPLGHTAPDAGEQNAVYHRAGERDAVAFTWFELDDRLDQVKRALAHHASQVTVDGDDVVHSGGQRTPIQTSVGLRVVP
ncbi:PIG-L family deacetylase [Paramicrobacterium agarici]|uniref:PIG-L family deacetylase n=1 Tax=Paramicrobacterium agarici TaxID=630514 RepID=UPI001150300A|nr:PIG-L family deacetylase [Microbacterium agarici]TQO22803.1 N-acetyl-1-D-myo-inositol-2-amino-2-deoxy-alpha-D-glucopyranoside deacetylase [Microbacterium agarici]